MGLAPAHGKDADRPLCWLVVALAMKELQASLSVLSGCPLFWELVLAGAMLQWTSSFLAASFVMPHTGLYILFSISFLPN